MSISASALPSLEDDLLAHAEALCDAGLYLQVQPLLPALASHETLRGKLIAQRAQSHLGARRSSDAFVARAWRANRNNPELMVAYLRTQVYRRGLFRAWQFLQQCRVPIDIAQDVAADWLSTQAYVHGLLRDFDVAQQFHDKARKLAPDDPWVQTEWTYVLEIRDQYAQAIEQARAVLHRHPRYRPAIQALAHFLTLVGKEDEALELLTDGVRNAESSSMASQLLDMQFERSMYREARDTLQYCDRYAPLSDKQYKTWLSARSADIALRLGEIEKAGADAKAAGGPFYEQIAARLATPGAAARRVLLPVGFVRQNYMTCAPATLTALSKYWGRQVDHLDLAEKICYDGTSYSSERTWAEGQEYIATEFSVDWNVTRQLIDAGVPFTLSTVYTGGGHLQAVIGYDELRGTLLIRDPFERTYGEFDAEKLFESHRSSGPRGMLILPAAEAPRIAGIVLPDADLWTDYFLVVSALQRHDRDAAVAAAGALAERAPQHQLGINARRAIAMYDGDEPAILATTEALLAMYPDDTNLRLSKASSLSLLGTRAQQVEWLEQLALAPKSDPQALIRYAGLLAEDDREARRVDKLLRQALHLAPNNASGWSELALLLWRTDRKEAGLDCYRIASCLYDTSEDYAVSYFRACLFLRRADVGLDYLRDRCKRLGGKSAQPVITLFQQLESVELTEEAMQMLEQALGPDQHNPQDPSLVLFAAETYLRYSMVEAAEALLKRSTLPAKQATSLRAQSSLAREMGDLERALALAREALALEPLSLSHYRQVSGIMGQLQGRAQAIAFLREACARFSFHCGLHEMLVDALGDQPLPEIEQVLRHLVGLNPNNLWAQRELASNLARQQKLDEAHSVMELACAMGPTHSYNHSTLAFVYIKQGNIEKAREHLRLSLKYSIDNDYALSTMIDLAPTLEERRATLDYIRAELIRQVTLGDALTNFQNAASTTLSPDELLDVLRDALDQRPDLWQAWVALGAQLMDAGKLTEAIELLDQATHKFPLLPRVYLDLGRAQVLNGRREVARETIRNALRINPHWSLAVRRYVNIFLDEGRDFEQALKALDVALARNPDNADLRGLRAEVLERMDRRDDAVAEVQRAIKSNPGLYWPWTLLRRLANELGDPKMTERIARELTVSHPGDHWRWIRLAEFCADPAEALAASEKAIALDPSSQTACETRLGILLRMGRYDELQDALKNLPWKDYVPIGVRVFEARLAREKGWKADASGKLRKLLDEDANNYDLWQEYADWCDEAEDHTPYLEAAENMLRLAPNYYVAHGYLADALVKNKQKERAIPHFERAFALDPSYKFGGLALADDALDKGQLERAAGFLATLSLHSDEPILLARRVRLAALQKNEAEALALAQQVFVCKSDNAWASTFSIEKLKDAGWHKQTIALIMRCARSGHCAVEAVRYLIDHQGTLFISQYRSVKKLLQDDPHHTIKRGFVFWLKENPESKLLERFMDDYREALRGDLQCWCEIGYLLLSKSKHLLAADWLGNWQQRADTPAWTLDNAALALRTIGSRAKARAASLRALELEPWNADAKTWLAVDAAYADDLEEMKRLLSEIDSARLRPYFQRLLEIVRHYLSALEGAKRADVLKALHTIRNQNGGGIVGKALMRELSGRLIMQSHWALRPFVWLRHYVIA
jgi:tetratricopeptide (TPR) repeat protein